MGVYLNPRTKEPDLCSSNYRWVSYVLKWNRKDLDTFRAVTEFTFRGQGAGHIHRKRQSQR